MRRERAICHAALVAVLLLLVASAAQAASGEGEGSGALLWQLANLGVLLGVLFFAARKPMAGFFADRRTEIRSDIDEAGKLLQAATTNFSEWQRKIVELESELESIRANARRWAEEERDRILAEAHAAAERLRSEAHTAIEQEVRRAKRELTREASELSLEVATRLLQEQVGQSDRDRLMDEFISSVERPRAGAMTRR